MFFLFSNLILLSIIAFLLIILSWVWPPNSPWAPWWRTNKKTALAICILANISKNDIVYDLGCGDATAIIMAGKRFDAKAVGIEIEPTRYLIAKFRVWFNKLSDRVVIKRKNLFDENLKDATVIIVYLVPKTLSMLAPKFQRECKKGTRIASYRYQIKGLKQKKFDAENDLRLYIL